MPIDMRHRVYGLILSSAVTRLRKMSPRRGSEWAQAMEAEAEVCGSERERLSWALGCLIASFRMSGRGDQIVYPLGLSLGLALMVGYEWHADESVVTLGVLLAITFGLGLLEPRRFLLSGGLIGLAVAGVLAFEVLSGLHPSYETSKQTFRHSLHWTMLAAPGLLAAGLGSGIGNWLSTHRSTR
jgi:hypothetical protein